MGNSATTTVGSSLEMHLTIKMFITRQVYPSICLQFVAIKRLA